MYYKNCNAYSPDWVLRCLLPQSTMSTEQSSAEVLSLAVFHILLLLHRIPLKFCFSQCLGDIISVKNLAVAFLLWRWCLLLNFWLSGAKNFLLNEEFWNAFIMRHAQTYLIVEVLQSLSSNFRSTVQISSVFTVAYHLWDDWSNDLPLQSKLVAKMIHIYSYLLVTFDSWEWKQTTMW